MAKRVRRGFGSSIVRTVLFEMERFGSVYSAGIFLHYEYDANDDTMTMSTFSDQRKNVVLQWNGTGSMQSALSLTSLTQ